MPVTYIDLRAQGEENARSIGVRQAASDRTGQQVVEVGTGLEARRPQVAIDAAIDDAHHRRHLSDVATDQVRQVAAPEDRREIVP